MIKILILSVILLGSCSSSARNNWSAWKRKGVSQQRMVWHFCNRELDGPKYHRKGTCYQAQECRIRRQLFGDKKECRAKTLFCAWGDTSCMIDNRILDRVIINREN